MVVANPYVQYKQVILNSSTKEDLVILAYEGAIRFLNKSMEGFEKNDFEKINYYILKTHAIISELIVSLNYEVGGEIAINLYRIYEYMNYRLGVANIKKDPKPVKEVMGLLDLLREAWTVARGKVYEDGEYSRNSQLH